MCCQQDNANSLEISNIFSLRTLPRSSFTRIFRLPRHYTSDACHRHASTRMSFPCTPTKDKRHRPSGTNAKHGKVSVAPHVGSERHKSHRHGVHDRQAPADQKVRARGRVVGVLAPKGQNPNDPASVLCSLFCPLRLPCVKSFALFCLRCGSLCIILGIAIPSHHKRIAHEPVHGTRRYRH